MFLSISGAVLVDVMLGLFGYAITVNRVLSYRSLLLIILPIPEDPREWSRHFETKEGARAYRLTILAGPLSFIAALIPLPQRTRKANEPATT
jgi:hypothetical protein